MLSLVALLTAVSAPLLELPEPFAVVPLPKEVTVTSQTGIRPSQLVSIDFDYRGDRLSLPYNLDHLSTSEFRKTSTGVRRDVTLRVSDIELPGEEGYELKVGLGWVEITGESLAGAFYGLRTLSQLVEDASEAGVAIPSMTIRDWPDIAYRAVHFDTKHHLDTMDTYYEAIDRLANLKVNAIVWEFEDKLRYRRQPKVGADNAISIEQMQALTRYARKRFIEISPLVQGLGHASFVLKHDEYKHLRDDPNSDWAFCPINEETYKVQFDLYLDAIEATPGARYLHIGGDEVNVGASKLAKESGLNALELHLYWLNKVNEFLLEQGRTPIMWDDMPLKHGGVYSSTHNGTFNSDKATELWENNRTKLDQVVEKFPKEAVYMRWNYGNPGLPGNNLALDWYRDSGLKAMAATAAQTRWTIFPRNNGNVGPIREFCQMTAKRGLDGILCTAWDDDSPHMSFYWRGWTPFADFSWNSDGRNEEEALMAFAQRAYGIEAAEAAVIGYANLEKAMNFWDTALITAGRRNVCMDATMNSLIELPTMDNRDEWLSTHAKRLERNEEAFHNEIAALDAMYLAEDTAIRNRYELTLSSELGQITLWSTLMLESISDWAHKPTIDNKDGIEAFATMIDMHWERFLATYQEKRMLNNPPGYILDQNHHSHQANSSNDPEWMIAVELKFRDKVMEWMKGK